MVARVDRGWKRFPDLLFKRDFLEQRALAIGADAAYGARRPEELALDAKYSFFESDVALNADLVGFYGSPGTSTMGILGRYSVEELEPILLEWAAKYDAANGERAIVPVLYLIYGTVWPGGDIGYLSDKTIERYIRFAQARNWLVFIDHQIGRFGVGDAMKRLLPWLKYPNVHLALDPEWRTDQPMRVIGSVTGDELNEAQETMRAYLESERIPGYRMLVVHQFNAYMITNRGKIRTDFDPVTLIHCADGFGPPSEKRASYGFNAEAANMPLKAFKLFFKSNFEFAGYDDPLLEPREVFALKPRPVFVMYQ
jgi:hypothetical protein